MLTIVNLFIKFNQIVNFKNCSKVSDYTMMENVSIDIKLLRSINNNNEVHKEGDVYLLSITNIETYPFL